MRPFAIDLDDRAFSLARDGRVLSSSPAVVFDGSTPEVVGTGAWHALRSHPTATSSRHLESVLTQSQAPKRALRLLSADLARRLEADRPQAGEILWVAAPAVADPQGLGIVVGIFRELSLPISGFIDSATAMAAALANDRSAIVLELGLHRVAATTVDVGSGIAKRRRSVRGQQGGLIELYHALLERVSMSMVRQTRFDPRQDAATEQQLFDLIPLLIRDSASGVVTATLRRGSDPFSVELSRDQLAEGARPLNREVLRLIHELRPAGMPVALIMPALLAGVPGLRDEIEQFVGCDLITCPDGFAGAAISATEHPETAAGAPLHLLRRCILHELHGQTVSRETLGGRKHAGPAPTHVSFGGRALAIGSEPIVAGRSPGTGQVLLLPEGLAGVSRRHCTLVRDGTELVLLDHSTFGTFVNGERVAERARVYAGDRVRLGEPGVELSLIAVGESAPGAQ